MERVADKVELHVLTRENVAVANGLPWSDPEGIATLSAEKREALLANPFAGDPKTPFRIIATQQSRVVGRLDVLSGSLAVEGIDVPCLWGSALRASQEGHSTGIGLLLILKLQELHDTVGACGVSQAAYPIYTRLRWIDCSLPRLVLPVRSTPVLRRYLGRNIPARMLAPAVDLGFRVARAGLGTFRPAGTSDLFCTPAESIPPALADLLDRPSPSIVGHRSAGWIEWLLRNSFNDASQGRRGLYVVFGADCDLVGYFIVKARHYESASQRGFEDLVLGSIQDWMVFEGGPRTEQVLALAAGELIKWEVDAVEVCVSESESVRLRRYGFVPAGALHVLVKARPPSLLALESYQRRDAWILRPAEGDNFYT